jgi:hypothetical protein
MEHSEECVQALEEFRVALAVYVDQWPDYCRSCSGRGEIVFSQSVPYGSTSASFDVSDVCSDCVEEDKCPRCGGLVPADDACGIGIPSPLWGENPERACPNCGWKWGAGGSDYVPESPECFCWLKLD